MNRVTNLLYRQIRVFTGLMVLLFTGSVQAVDAFDHFTTGFPLTGKHEFVDCADCHIAGRFKGTTTECGLCHNNLIAEGKHPSHIISSSFCDDCHTDLTWSNARFEHSDVTSACTTCHNNFITQGLTPDHIATSQNCEACHNTISFSRVTRVDHGEVFGLCSSCHNGIIASGKHPTHIQTSAECDVCHVAGGSWSLVTFDHSEITGSCQSCHDGVTATGKDPDHFITTADCNDCHTTDVWTPVLLFTHSSANYPGDHRTALDCNDCHISNSEVVNWPSPSYQPECAGCHESDFKPDAHKVTNLISNPEFWDCSGSCHIEGVLESGEHSVNGSEW